MHSASPARRAGARRGGPPYASGPSTPVHASSSSTSANNPTSPSVAHPHSHHRPPSSRNHTNTNPNNKDGGVEGEGVGVGATKSGKPVPTFTSCLSIPVQGALPISRSDNRQAVPEQQRAAHAAAVNRNPHATSSTSTSAAPGGNSGTAASTTTANAAPNSAVGGASGAGAGGAGGGGGDNSRRAPRKSKTEALAALQSHAHANALVGDDGGVASDQQAGAFREVMMDVDGAPIGVVPIPVNPKLDFSKIRTDSPRDVDGAGLGTGRRVSGGGVGGAGLGGDAGEGGRPFGLENCPVFEPSEEEFRDPMGYVRKIAEEGKRYGMAKIIPPKGWKMPFVTDTEVRFSPPVFHLALPLSIVFLAFICSFR